MATLRGVLILLALVGASVAQAQRPVPPPVKEHKFDIESSYIRIPPPSGDERYARINGDRLKEHVRALTAMSRKYRDAGERFWGRLPGSRADADAEQYIAAKFREYGLQDVRLEPISLPPQWAAPAWSFTATGSGATLTPASIWPAERSVPTPPEGLNLEIVWVGIGTELDYLGRDVKGKLVFMHSDPRPNAFQGTARSNGAIERAVAGGAAAVLINVNIPGNVRNSFSPAKGLPTFSIGTSDAEALKALMAKGRVTVALKLATEERPGLTSHNVWGTVRGVSAEEVFVFAHHDGLFEGAFDNASGVATLLGLAEYFAKVPPGELRRTVKLVATAAQTDGGQGANAIIKQPDALKNVVLVINSEHTSATQMSLFGAAGMFRTTAVVSPKRWWINGSDKLASLAFATYRQFGIPIWDWEMYDGGGIGPFSRMTSLQLLDSPVYHSSDGDREEIVPPSGLEAVTRAYAKIIDATGTMTRAELQPAPQ